MNEYYGHKLIDASYIGMYYCTECGIKIFIGNENDAYKNTLYGGRIVYYVNNIKGWEDLNINCNEMQIKKLLE